MPIKVKERRDKEGGKAMLKLWRSKWFILIAVWSVFIFFAGSKVALAQTDSQLTAVLSAALDGLREFFNFLISVLGAL